MSSLREFLRDDQTVAASIYIILISIVTIRVRAGYFPIRTRWFALFGLLGILNLFLKHAQRGQAKHPSLSTLLHK